MQKYAPESVFVFSTITLQSLISISTGDILKSQDLLLSQRIWFQVYGISEKKDLQKRILVYKLNGRDTSINSSKHGSSTKYLKSDSIITGDFTHLELHRYTITDLRTFRVKYPSNVMIGHLNTNSIRNKFESLSFLIGGKVDIF